jgi:hypothetical protein
MGKKHQLDRSTMFTVLLDITPAYGRMESRAGERVVTEALLAWYDSTATNMHSWAKEWVTANRPDLLPLR